MRIPAVIRTAPLLAVVGLLGACDSGGSTPSTKERAVDVYDAVVRWLAGADGTDPDPLPVFVEPRGEGTSIDLDVQAGILDATEDVATVTFIDSREEALVDVDGVLVAADDGIFVRLGPVDDEGDHVELDIDLHERDDEFVGLRFVLEQSEGHWQVLGPPTEVEAD